MARKKTSKATTRRSSRRDSDEMSSRAVSSGRRTTSASAEFSGNRDIKDMIRDFAANPAVRYVAGGIATAMLAKLASSLSGRYPEISRLLNENLENFEGRLKEFRGISSEQVDTQH